jgi:anaerobic magnesium-protoporphyrin IX monomethyl ester cyclase
MRVLLVVYDNESYISWFPQGLAYIASALRNNGHEVTIYNQDVYHWPEAHLTQFLDTEHFDAIGVSVIAGYFQFRKLLLISDAINNSKNRPFYILGGHGPAPEPEYFLKKTGADLVVIGEGELTIIELLENIKEKKEFSSVKGIAYMDNGILRTNSRRPLIQNIDEIPFPAWDLFPMDHYSLLRSFPHIENTERCLPVLSGRGCIFQCNFCFRLDKGFRPRTIGNILDEIEILKTRYNISSIEFSDELLMSSEQRTIEICEGIIDSKIKIKWGCNGRLNFAKKPVLELMKKAGCVFINYGIESLDQKALNTMKKGLTIKMINIGVQNTLDAGITPGLNIIFGNIGETYESLQKGLEFLLKYDDHSQMRTIRPVTPYPGSPLYDYAIKNGLLKDCEEFYEKKHINSDLLAVNFTNLTDDEFHMALNEANSKLISVYYETALKRSLEICNKLYTENNSSFRGFRQS